MTDASFSNLVNNNNIDLILDPPLPKSSYIKSAAVMWRGNSTPLWHTLATPTPTTTKATVKIPWVDISQQSGFPSVPVIGSNLLSSACDISLTLYETEADITSGSTFDISWSIPYQDVSYYQPPTGIKKIYSTKKDGERINDCSLSTGDSSINIVFNWPAGHPGWFNQHTNTGENTINNMVMDISMLWGALHSDNYVKVSNSNMKFVVLHADEGGSGGKFPVIQIPGAKAMTFSGGTPNKANVGNGVDISCIMYKDLSQRTDVNRRLFGIGKITLAADVKNDGIGTVTALLLLIKCPPSPHYTAASDATTMPFPLQFYGKPPSGTFLTDWAYTGDVPENTTVSNPAFRVQSASNYVASGVVSGVIGQTDKEWSAAFNNNPKNNITAYPQYAIAGLPNSTTHFKGDGVNLENATAYAWTFSPAVNLNYFTWNWQQGVGSSATWGGMSNKFKAMTDTATGIQYHWYVSNKNHQRTFKSPTTTTVAQLTRRSMTGTFDWQKVDAICESTVLPNYYEGIPPSSSKRKGVRPVFVKTSDSGYFRSTWPIRNGHSHSNYNSENGQQIVTYHKFTTSTQPDPPIPTVFSMDTTSPTYIARVLNTAALQDISFNLEAKTDVNGAMSNVLFTPNDYGDNAVTNNTFFTVHMKRGAQDLSADFFHTSYNTAGKISDMKSKAAAYGYVAGSGGTHSDCKYIVVDGAGSAVTGGGTTGTYTLQKIDIYNGKATHASVTSTVAPKATIDTLAYEELVIMSHASKDGSNLKSTNRFFTYSLALTSPSNTTMAWAVVNSTNVIRMTSVSEGGSPTFTATGSSATLAKSYTCRASYVVYKWSEKCTNAAYQWQIEGTGAPYQMDPVLLTWKDNPNSYGSNQIRTNMVTNSKMFGNTATTNGKGSSGRLIGTGSGTIPVNQFGDAVYNATNTRFNIFMIVFPSDQTVNINGAASIKFFPSRNGYQPGAPDNIGTLELYEMGFLQNALPNDEAIAWINRKVTKYSTGYGW